MWTCWKSSVVVRLLMLPLAALLIAAGPAEKPSCDQLAACRQLKGAAIESQASGKLDRALEKFQAAYALSQDYRLKASIGRTLQQQGKREDAFTAFQEYLQTAPYKDPMQETVEGWMRELLETAHAEEPVVKIAPPPPTPPPAGASSSGLVAPVFPQADAPCAHSSRGLLISGSVLTGVGAATALAFGVAYKMLDGRTMQLPPTSNTLFPAEFTDAKPALAGVAIGGVSIVVGAVLLGVHYRSRNSAKATEGRCAL